MEGTSNNALMVIGHTKEREKSRYNDRSKSRGKYGVRSKSWGRFGPKYWICGKNDHLKRDYRSKSADLGKNFDKSTSAEAKKSNDEVGDA